MEGLGETDVALNQTQADNANVRCVRKGQGRQSERDEQQGERHVQKRRFMGTSMRAATTS